MRVLKIIIFVLVIGVISACSASKPYVKKDLRNWAEKPAPEPHLRTDNIFLLGDAGELVYQDDQYNFLLNRIRETQDPILLFLGDNIYPHGLPDSLEKGYDLAKRRIDALISLTKESKGRAIFIHGNHDWGQGHPNGWRWANNQEKHVDQALGYNALIPDNGCPGPVEIPVGNDIVIIAVNTQWWIHEFEKPAGSIDGCQVSTDAEFLTLLEDAISRNQNKVVILATHHPVFTRGSHNGYFNLKDHVFPLSALNKNLMIPLPVLGSIHPAYRAWIGDKQDIRGARYKLLNRSVRDILSRYPSVIHTAGHDHSLQYRQEGDDHYLVSGAACKATFAARGGRNNFSHGAKGVMQLTRYVNGEIWLQIWEPKFQANSDLAFRHRLFTKEHQVDQVEQEAYADSERVVVAGGGYQAGPLKRLILGAHYRAAWGTPLRLSLIDMQRDHGGLTPIKKGGGQQTRSLRLQGGDGHQYVFRSVQKYPANALPKILRKTFVLDLVQDQISASHPYGALVIPPLAHAAGVPHTRPQIMLAPNSPRLGQYRKEFAHMMVLYEERPAGDMSDMDHFANGEKGVNTFDVLADIQSTPKHKVDEQAVLRARIFDIWLNDWDRHDDQWRWARHKDGEGAKTFSPIPRDRDQVFFKFEGIVPWLTRRKWANPKFQHFDHKIPNVSGLGFNARFFDRSFLTRIPRSEWIEMAETLQAALTDSVIHRAFMNWPKEIHELDAADIQAKLKSRRALLPGVAEEYYEILAEEVDVVGTKKRELFLIQRLSDDSTRVDVYQVTKEGERKRHSFGRTFYTKETKEIRCYGLGGDDHFLISGHVKKGIQIRVIGGKGGDRFTDSSSVAGLRRKTHLYDKPKNSITNVSRESRVRFRDNSSVNAYNRKAFAYDVVAPLLFFGYSPDDKIFLGGGISSKTHGFRKVPYKSFQKLRANIAYGTAAFNLNYEGDFVDVIGQWDLQATLNVLAPNYTLNYFGTGNETKSPPWATRDFYRMRLNQMHLGMTLKRFVGCHGDFQIGPFAEYQEIDKTFARFISLPESNVDPAVFDPTHYVGLMTKYGYERLDDQMYPQRGVQYEWSGRAFSSTMDEQIRIQTSASVALFLTKDIGIPVTLASRFGAFHNFGRYALYHSAILGGQNAAGLSANLRGFAQFRFYGRSSVYNNTDLRIRLFEFSTFIFPGELGLIGFLDHGRVWADKETSNVIHQSYGIGLWVSPFGKAIIRGTYGFTNEGNTVAVGIGFLY
jgi:hypothetical protein